MLKCLRRSLTSFFKLCCSIGAQFSVVQLDIRHAFFERKAAAAAALDVAAARQLWRVLRLGAEREADGCRRRANDAGTTHAAGAG
jgi:hypothetical protein